MSAEASGGEASEAARLAGSVSENGASELRDDPSAAASRLLPPGPASPAASHAPFPLTLRAATEADLDAIWAIESAVFGAEAWSRDLMRDELTADLRCYLVLVNEAGAIVGYGGLLAVGTEGDIQTIALSPDARGAGQGRRLMNALLDAVGDLFQPFLIFFSHIVLLSQLIELKKARPRTGRDKPMRERASYSFSERMLLSGGRIFAALARKLSASRRRSPYGSRTEILRLGTR